jgi:hypothetical protein
MRVLSVLATFIAALAGSIVGMILILPLSLVVHEAVILPLALAVAALLAALSASWTGTLLTPNHTRTRLVRVVAATEAAATLVALLLIALLSIDAAMVMTILPTPAVIGGVASLVLALSATVATGHFRRSQYIAGRDAILTVAFLVLAVVSVPAVLFVASLFGLTGA